MTTAASLRKSIEAPPSTWDDTIKPFVAPALPRVEHAGKAYHETAREQRNPSDPLSRPTTPSAGRSSPGADSWRTSSSSSVGADDDEDAEMRERMKQKKAKNNGAHLAFTDNYYELLGLKEIGELATPADLKKAYRQMVLKYHPDKNESVSDEIFKKIQVAYDTLCDADKRKEYDSTLPFDDSIPSANFSGDFFAAFRPAFRRNGKWSVTQPVPSLGNANTPIAKVRRFYAFWESFRSWRSWPHLCEWDLEDAESREERRWMERQNKAAQAKHKRAEKARINELVVRAQKADPRLAAAKKSDAAKKEANKKKRYQSKAAGAQANEASKEKRRVEEEAVKAAKKAEREAAQVREKMRAAMKASAIEALQRNRICADLPHARLVELLALHAADGAAPFAAAVETALAAECRPIPAAELAEQDVLVAKRKAAEALAARATCSSAVAAAEASAAVARGGEWTADEITALAKAVAKYPVGTRNRWELIQHTLPRRTTKEIIQRTKQIAAESDARKLAERGIALPNAFAASQEKAKNKTTAAQVRSDSNAAKDAAAAKVSSVASEAAAAAGESADDDGEWSAAEQKLLEEALKKFPGPGKERWTDIAAHVGRSRKQCVARFKYCLSLVQQAK